MRRTFGRTLMLAALAIAGSASAQVTLYENDNFQGRSITTERALPDLDRNGLNNRASSLVVQGERWEVCEEARFGGRCVVLRPGHYPSLGALRLNNRISSVREVERNARIDDNRYANAPATSQAIFYERDGFEGRSLTVGDPLDDFRRSGFNDRASSVMVVGERWELCESVAFGGRCVVLRPGRYPSLASMGLSDRISSARGAGRLSRNDDPRPAPSAAQIILYESEGFGGRSFTASNDIDNFRNSGFNDRASSAVVMGGQWEVCLDSEYRGRCSVLRPGRYPTLNAMNMNDRISSMRAVESGTQVSDERYAPAPIAVYDNRRRDQERVYEVTVTSARAVVGPAERRCWMEPEQVTQARGDVNVGGALAGALIGGILGHQVGGGTGKDIATAGGAIAGAYVGSNVGRDGRTATQNVERCSTTASQAPPAYWDVDYTFRGEQHRIQMTTRPGPTLMVNEKGEPRV
ncbi:MAG: glycine zipper 2TM domain-containing protein [Rhodoferax sp.]|nr:glycine zipper 2TM domain-containing protein [Rhodoferax sp.]